MRSRGGGLQGPSVSRSTPGQNPASSFSTGIEITSGAEPPGTPAGATTQLRARGAFMQSPEQSPRQRDHQRTSGELVRNHPQVRSNGIVRSNNTEQSPRPSLFTPPRRRQSEAGAAQPTRSGASIGRRSLSGLDTGLGSSLAGGTPPGNSNNPFRDRLDRLNLSPGAADRNPYRLGAGNEYQGGSLGGGHESFPEHNAGASGPSHYYPVTRRPHPNNSRSSRTVCWDGEEWEVRPSVAPKMVPAASIIPQELPPPSTTLARVAENASILLELFSKTARSDDEVDDEQKQMIESVLGGVLEIRRHFRVVTARKNGSSEMAEVEDMKMDVGCIICYTSIADMVFIPCKHLVLCMVCILSQRRRTPS